MTSATRARILAVTVFFGILDAIMKMLALRSFPDDSQAQGIASLALHHNYGIAFNIPVPLYAVIPFTIAVLVFFAGFAYHDWSMHVARSMASCVVIIGALGNLVDRVVHGFTTDWLILLERSAVNISDGIILVGILLFLWYSEHTPQVSDSH